MPRVLIYDGRVQKIEIELETRIERTIGRSGEATIRLDNELTSRIHAKLRPGVKGRWVIEDLDSENGVWLNGERIAGHATLFNGDRLEFGPHVLIFQDVEASRDAPRGWRGTRGRIIPREVPETKALPGVTAAAIRKRSRLRFSAHLMVPQEGGGREGVPLKGDKIVLGWGDGADIVLPEKTLLAPDEAAELRRVQDGWTIRPLSKLAQAKVGGDKLREPRLLQDGDEILLRGAQIRFHDAVRVADE